jgi:hypothetical protein
LTKPIDVFLLAPGLHRLIICFNYLNQYYRSYGGDSNPELPEYEVHHYTATFGSRLATILVLASLCNASFDDAKCYFTQHLLKIGYWLLVLI